MRTSTSPVDGCRHLPKLQDLGPAKFMNPNRFHLSVSRLRIVRGRSRFIVLGFVFCSLADHQSPTLFSQAPLPDAPNVQEDLCCLLRPNRSTFARCEPSRCHVSLIGYSRSSCAPCLICFRRVIRRTATTASESLPFFGFFNAEFRWLARCLGRRRCIA
jgi:hypothetical protein